MDYLLRASHEQVTEARGGGWWVGGFGIGEGGGQCGGGLRSSGVVEKDGADGPLVVLRQRALIEMVSSVASILAADPVPAWAVLGRVPAGVRLVVVCGVREGSLGGGGVLEVFWWVGAALAVENGCGVVGVARADHEGCMTGLHDAAVVLLRGEVQSEAMCVDGGGDGIRNLQGPGDAGGCR